MLIVAVLLATVVLRVALVAAAVYLLLPRAPDCPRCHEPTVSVRHAVLDGLAWLVGERLCLVCGWSGVMRGRRRATQAPQRGVISRTARS